jgi:hypothetical protein
MKTLFFALLIFSINGCTLCEPEIVTVVKTRKIRPPNSLLRVYKIPEPIDKKTYLSIDTATRQKVQTLYIIQLLKTLGNYKHQTESLVIWKKRS